VALSLTVLTIRAASAFVVGPSKKRKTGKPPTGHKKLGPPVAGRPGIRDFFSVDEGNDRVRSMPVPSSSFPLSSFESGRKVASDPQTDYDDGELRSGLPKKQTLCFRKSKRAQRVAAAHVAVDTASDSELPEESAETNDAAADGEFNAEPDGDDTDPGPPGLPNAIRRSTRKTSVLTSAARCYCDSDDDFID
jgi:hypothetical protein